MAEIHYICFQYFKDEKMKKGFNILLIVCAALLTLSCNKTKSYTDMLNDEKKAIDRLIDREGIEVLKHYPEDGVFKENQFVKLENGVYMNVIDSGTGQRAVLNKTKVFYRCIAFYPLDSTYLLRANSLGLITPYWLYGNRDTYRSVNYGPNSNGTSPYSFTYGDYNSEYISEGLIAPLEYVGHNAKVKLIVPFKRGLSIDNGNGQPIYYEILHYKFEEYMN